MVSLITLVHELPHRPTVHKNSAIRKLSCHLIKFWDHPTDCRPIGLAGAWEALFAYDSIIFSLTIYKTWKARRDHAVTGVEIPLISLILRDGEMPSEFPTPVSLLYWFLGAIYFS